MHDEFLSPDLRTVAQLFESKAIYVVPVYQRSFAWRAEQIEQLIGDIRDAIAQGEEKYFLGNVIVTPRGSESSVYEVIDGQQRLTTLYLLLTFLARTDNPTDRKFQHHTTRLRYESRPRSSEALRRLDGGFPENSANTAPGSLEDSGIHQGYNIIQQYMDQHFSGDALQIFGNYLLHHVQLVRASLPASTDLNRYFEVMNTRGAQLQPVDIVKARLMSYLPLESERACFAWLWDACSKMDAYVQVPLARGNLSLRDALFDENWSWLAASSFEDLLEQFNEHVNAPSGPRQRTASQASSISIDEALTIYSEKNGSEAADQSDADRFSSTIPFNSLLLHTLRLLDSQANPLEDEGSLDDKRLIKLFNTEFSEKRPDRVREFIALLLRTRVAFDSFILKREFLATYSDEGEWSLRKVVKTRSGNKSTVGYRNTYAGDSKDDSDTLDPTTRDLLLLQGMLRVTYTSPRTMHWVTLALHHVLQAETPANVSVKDLVFLLQTYARDKVREAFPFANEPVGFNISRIVFAYLDYLLVVHNRVPNLDSDYRFSFRTSIEHFYPQSPDEQQSGQRVSAMNLHQLGNLALVSVGANSKFNNSLPLAKATNYRHTIERQSPKLHLMAATTRDLGVWGDSEVEAHHQEIVNLLRQDLEIQPQISQSGA
ncbi:hypothetical protein NtRootA9_10800 [Arthrobacter sp. NtRootA9]|nr:hypothetical protein NtRootA9_10800 [Arthrobacter sp. NtRootA9]